MLKQKETLTKKIQSSNMEIEDLKTLLSESNEKHNKQVQDLTAQYDVLLRQINTKVESAKQEQEIITKEKKVLREKLGSTMDTSVPETTPDAKVIPDEKNREGASNPSNGD